MGYVILLCHSLSLLYNYSQVSFDNGLATFLPNCMFGTQLRILIASVPDLCIFIFSFTIISTETQKYLS